MNAKETYKPFFATVYFLENFEVSVKAGIVAFKQLCYLRIPFISSRDFETRRLYKCVGRALTE